MRPTRLTPLEDAALRFVLAHAGESGGWLDLTRIASQTGRMLPDVRDAVNRLSRRRLLVLDEKAPHTDRWMRFVLGAETSVAPRTTGPVA